MPNPKNIEKYKFTKGHKGTGGRPKGSKNMTTILNQILEGTVVITDNEGRKSKFQVLEAVLNGLVINALERDIKSIRELLDRVEGKPIQKTALIDPNTADNIPTIRILGGLPPRNTNPPPIAEQQEPQDGS